MNFKKLAILAGFVAATSAAYAAVTFDASTGTGFVGKGDVQLAFGWNNAALQKNASAVTFGYEAKDTYDAECYWETTTGKGTIIVHDINVPKHVDVNSTVNGDPRQLKGQTQFTGYILKGFGSVTPTGTAPLVGDACPGGNPGTVINVTLVSSTGYLSAIYNGVTVALPITPVL